MGLGNPGKEYAGNKHNIGFMCVSYFAKEQGFKLDLKQSKAHVGRGKVAGKEVVLAKPKTYMNCSGESVDLLVKRYKVALDELLVIHDDMDLPLGKIRIRQGSSAGGHKGAQSIISYLGSQEFVRLRVGIGHPGRETMSEEDVIDFVLNDFTPEERKVIMETVPKVNEALLCFLAEGLTPTMNKFNG